MARLDEVTREAVKLAAADRLALARTLLDLQPTTGVADAARSWDDEIRARVKAVDDGKADGILYEDVRREMDARYGP